MEDINTNPTLKCAFCQEKRYIEDGVDAHNLLTFCDYGDKAAFKREP